MLCYTKNEDNGVVSSFYESGIKFNRGKVISMKKLSVILLGPVFMNIVTFTKRFLYDPVIMFMASFLIFFVSLYIDFNKKTSRKWRFITLLDVFVTLVVTKCASIKISSVVFCFVMLLICFGAMIMLENKKNRSIHC
jgi:hypothetical protein